MTDETEPEIHIGLLILPILLILVGGALGYVLAT